MLNKVAIKEGKGEVYKEKKYCHKGIPIFIGTGSYTKNNKCKCRVQNVKVKMTSNKIIASGYTVMLQFVFFETDDSHVASGFIPDDQS